MEQDSARRRSSRLAAKGVSTPSRVNSSAKKIPKSVEKPTPSKRSKRKIGDVALPDPKKNKIAEEEKQSAEANEKTIDNNEILPMEVENNEPSTELKQNDKSSEGNTLDSVKNDLSADENEETNKKEDDLEIEKNDEIEEGNEIQKEDEVEKEDEIIEHEDELEIDNEIEEVKEKLDDNKIPEETVSDSSAEPKNAEPIIDDVTQNTETKPDPSVLLQNSNGNDDKEIEVQFKKDVTPNGDTIDAIEAKTTNGNELETVEQTTKVVLADVEPDVKAAIPIPAANSINDGDDQEGVAETVTVTPDDKSPNVDQSTTVVS